MALTTAESKPFETFGSTPGRPSESYNWKTGKLIVSIKLYPYLFMYFIVIRSISYATFIVNRHAWIRK